jgi:hypothetical protein
VIGFGKGVTFLEKGGITESEFMEKLSAERAGCQGMLERAWLDNQIPPGSAVTYALSFLSATPARLRYTGIRPFSVLLNVYGLSDRQRIPLDFCPTRI